MVAAKQAYFHAVAQHRMGLVAQANKSYGEAVARMKVCRLCDAAWSHTAVASASAMKCVCGV